MGSNFKLGRHLRRHAYGGYITVKGKSTAPFQNRDIMLHRVRVISWIVDKTGECFFLLRRFVIFDIMSSSNSCYRARRVTTVCRAQSLSRRENCSTTKVATAPLEWQNIGLTVGHGSKILWWNFNFGGQVSNVEIKR